MNVRLNIYDAVCESEGERIPAVIAVVNPKRDEMPMEAYDKVVDRTDVVEMNADEEVRALKEREPIPGTDLTLCYLNRTPGTMELSV